MKLHKNDKKLLNRPTMPRTELDLIALNMDLNELLVVEVKSYLNSPGVVPNDLLSTFDVPTGPYKLLTCELYRDMVIKQLRHQLISQGMINYETRFKVGLAAGKIYKDNEVELYKILDKKGFVFWGPSKIQEALLAFSKSDYENDPFYLTSKILLGMGK